MIRTPTGIYPDVRRPGNRPMELSHEFLVAHPDFFTRRYHHIPSCWRLWADSEGHIWLARLFWAKRLVPWADDRGYLYVFHDVLKKQVGVHRLVLEAFAGPCPDGYEGCHYDGNPANNRLDNLRWDTRLENARDLVRHRKERAATTR